MAYSLRNLRFWLCRWKDSFFREADRIVDGELVPGSAAKAKSFLIEEIQKEYTAARSREMPMDLSPTPSPESDASNSTSNSIIGSIRKKIKLAQDEKQSKDSGEGGVTKLVEQYLIMPSEDYRVLR